MKMPNATKLVSFTDASGRKRERYETLTTGRKLRSRVSHKDADGNFTEPEPTVWHIYRMFKFVRAGVEKQSLEILDDNFAGTAAEAIAVAEAHKAGG